MTTPRSHINVTCHASPVYRAASPKLSVLIPYYKDDASDLFAALTNGQAKDADVEILLYDDGTGDAALNTHLQNSINASQTPSALFVADVNAGRSSARNYLMSMSRADWVLFLDADMRPVQTSFLSDYLQAIQDEESDILFGGFHVPDHTDDPDRELHRVFSLVSDALNAQERRQYGPQYVCSSNLCVRKTVMEAEPFDAAFSGWGWEDSEWAARVGAVYTLSHVDIPALHLGLETTDTLLNRFMSSGPNYARFTDRHPDLARRLKLYRVMRILKNIPGQKLARPFLRAMVKTHLMPVNIRLSALKLWRASWYVESMP